MTVRRPLKINGTSGLIEMSDAEIQSFFTPFLYNRINESSRLVYTFSTSTTGVDAGGYVETHYDSSTNASSGQIISGHTYYRDVSSLATTNYYLRLANT